MRTERRSVIVVDLMTPRLQERRELLEKAKVFLMKLVTGKLRKGEEKVFFESLSEAEGDYLTSPSDIFQGKSPMAALRRVIDIENRGFRQN